MPGTQEGDGRNRTCHLGRTCSKNNPNSPESPAHIVQKLDTRYTYEKIIMWSGRSVEFLPDKYSMPYSFFFCKFCESFFGSFAVLLFPFFCSHFFVVRSYPNLPEKLRALLIFLHKKNRLSLQQQTVSVPMRLLLVFFLPFRPKVFSHSLPEGILQILFYLRFSSF